MQKRITSAQIAEMAHVNQSTVSRALNPDLCWMVGQKKRDEILTLCRKYGVVSRSSIRRKGHQDKTFRIALVLGSIERDLNSIGYSILIRRMCDILQESGYILELIRIDFRPEKRTANVRRILRSKQADVYVIAGLLLNGQSLEQLHCSSSRLLLMLNEDHRSIAYPEYQWLSYFYWDNVEATQEAFHSLPADLRSNILYFGHGNLSSENKIAQLRKLLSRRGRENGPAELLYGTSEYIHPNQAYRVARICLKQNLRVLDEYQVFWCGGIGAYALYDELTERKRQAGRDFHIITYDSRSSLMPEKNPDFGLICRDLDRASRLLCERILVLVDNPSPGRIICKSFFQPPETTVFPGRHDSDKNLQS